MAVDLVGKHRHSYQIYMCTRRSVCGFVEVNCMRSPIPTFHGLEFRSLESEFWTGFLILFPNWFHQWQIHIGHHFYEGSCHYMAGIIWMICHWGNGNEFQVALGVLGFVVPWDLCFCLAFNLCFFFLVNLFILGWGKGILISVLTISFLICLQQDQVLKSPEAVVLQWNHIWNLFPSLMTANFQQNLFWKIQILTLYTCVKRWMIWMKIIYPAIHWKVIFYREHVSMKLPGALLNKLQHVFSRSVPLVSSCTTRN